MEDETTVDMRQDENSDMEMKDVDLQGMSMTNRKKSMIIKRDDSYIKPTKVEVVTKSLAKYLIPIAICLSAVIGLAIIFIGIFASQLRKFLIFFFY